MLTPTLMMFVSFLEAQDFPLLLEPKDLSSIQKITSGVYLCLMQEFSSEVLLKDSSTCGLCIETRGSYLATMKSMVTKMFLKSDYMLFQNPWLFFMLFDFSIVGEIFWIKVVF